jgi:glycosidase
VRSEVHALMRFWLDRGVDGFRMDVIDLISKPRDAQGRESQVLVPGPRLVEHRLALRREVLNHCDTLTVGEAPRATPELARTLTDADRAALNMLLQLTLKAQAQKADPVSVLNSLRRLVCPRRELPALVHGDVLPVQEDHLQVFACLRRWQGESWLVVCNCGPQPAEASWSAFCAPGRRCCCACPPDRGFVHAGSGPPALQSIAKAATVHL